MLASHSRRIAGTLIVLGGTAALAAEPTPEEALKELGLTRQGVCFVVASDAAVTEYYNQKVRPYIQYMAAAHGKYAADLENDAMLEQAQFYRDDVITERDNTASNLNNMPRASALQRSQAQAVQQYLNQVNAELRNTETTIAALRRRRIPPFQKEKLLKDFETKRGDFLKAASEFRPVVDKTLAEYEELKQNPAVKNALNAYSRLTKANLPLGPSKDFKKAVGLVKDAERSYSPETAAPKRKVKRKIKRK